MKRMIVQDSSNAERGREGVFCLIIPTYNEGENVESLVKRIEQVELKLPFQFNLIFVDDNSKDGTAEVIKALMQENRWIKLIQRPKPTGLGSAYLDGFAYAIDKFNADFVGEMDADLQHPPETLVDMCNTIVGRKVDVVLGSRYVPGGGASGWSLGRRIISRGANSLSKIFLRVPVADSTTGFRIIRASTARSLFDHDLSAKGYAFQVESLYVYKQNGARFAEVPYNFETRKAGKTKLDWKEIFRFAGVTIKTGIVGVRRKKEGSVDLSDNKSALSEPSPVTE